MNFNSAQTTDDKLSQPTAVPESCWVYLVDVAILITIVIEASTVSAIVKANTSTVVPETAF